MNEPETPKLTPEQINQIYSSHSADLLHDQKAAGDHDFRTNYDKFTTDVERDRKNKYLQTIARSTVTVGWFYLVLCPMVAFLLGWTGNYSLLPWYLGIIVPICLLFIVSGRFIIFNGGKIVPWFLLINAILGIVSMPAVLSGIIGIQSLVGYVYYRQLRKKGLLSEVNISESRPRVITIIMLIICIGAGSYALTYKNPMNPMFGKIEFISNLSNDRVVSAKYKFSIRMPFKPSITNDIAKESMKYSVPYTVIESSGTATSAYIVAAHNYSAVEGKLNEISMLGYSFAKTVVSMDGTVVKKEPVLFNQLNAFSGEFTSPDTKTKATMTSYYKAFIRDKYIYEVYTIGLDRAAFDKFINSFQFEN